MSIKDLSSFTKLSEETPEVKEMVIFIADGIVLYSGGLYQTNPYCGWLDEQGGFVRWPHPTPPTHFKRIWEKV